MSQFIKTIGTFSSKFMQYGSDICPKVVTLAEKISNDKDSNMQLKVIDESDLIWNSNFGDEHYDWAKDNLQLMVNMAPMFKIVSDDQHKKVVQQFEEIVNNPSSTLCLYNVRHVVVCKNQNRLFSILFFLCV